MCVATAAAMIAGAGSTGGILAAYIAKLKTIFRASGLGLFQKKEK
jgi:ketopantoate reductase